jgi:hypothetical protein
LPSGAAQPSSGHLRFPRLGQPAADDPYRAGYAIPGDAAAAPGVVSRVGPALGLRWLQNAGFLEEYLLAKHQLQLDSRAFAPLRRDERNAWDRAPGAHEAYIAPALKLDGSANPRWITRSDWDLDRRIVATPRIERLFDLFKVFVLAGRPGSAGAGYLGARRPVDALLEKYAQDTLDTEPPSASASDNELTAWRADVRDRAGTLIGEICRDDEPDRKQIARQLAGLSDLERVWGRDTGTKARGRGRKPR